MTNIFSDLHHDQLFNSLKLLFEKRLGGVLLKPVGLEWWEQGFWKVNEPYNNDPKTAQQYLSLRFQEQDSQGIYHVDGDKAITLDKFKEMEIDIVIASIPQHLAVYTELIRKFKPKAKLIYQIGNHFGPIDFDLCHNLMASTSPFTVPINVNAVFYHQEFDLNVFRYEPPVNRNKVYSFVHCLKEKPSDYQDYLDYKKSMPDFEFKSFGASCDDGCIQGQNNVANKMREAGFGFHLKEGGDGMGHCIHNFFAIGRPVIVRKSQYQGKLAGELMIDGQTCIDLDQDNLENNVKRIEYFSQPEEHIKLCQNAYEQFKKVVDYEKEFIKIQSFLGRLK